MLQNDIPNIDAINEKLDIIARYIEDNNVTVYTGQNIKIGQR